MVNLNLGQILSPIATAGIHRYGSLININPSDDNDPAWQKLIDFGYDEVKDYEIMKRCCCQGQLEKMNFLVPSFQVFQLFKSDDLNARSVRLMAVVEYAEIRMNPRSSYYIFNSFSYTFFLGKEQIRGKWKFRRKILKYLFPYHLIHASVYNLHCYIGRKSWMEILAQYLFKIFFFGLGEKFFREN